MKLAAGILWARTVHAWVTILTETHITTDPSILLGSLEGAGVFWPGLQVFFCPGNGHTGGVTILISPGAPITDLHQFPSPTAHPIGRVVRIDCKLEGTETSILGVYAPAQPCDRREFFELTLPGFLPEDNRPLILGGDWNCVLDTNDCVYPGATPIPANNSRLVGSTSLQDLMDRLYLHDIWRERNPRGNDFTHFSQSALSGARLDRWLINTAFQQRFHAKSSILPISAIQTDHLPVDLTITSARPTFRGLGIRGFPLMLLDSRDSMVLLEQWCANHINTSRLGTVEGSASMAQWENFKKAFVDQAWVIYSAARAAGKAAIRRANLSANSTRVALLNSSPGETASTLAAWAQAYSQGTSIWKDSLVPTVEAASILHHLAADSSSYYFFNSSKAPAKSIRIERLHRPGRQAEDDPDSVDLDTGTGTMKALSYGQSLLQLDVSHRAVQDSRGY